MQNTNNSSRNFFQAPQSVASFVAAFLEPLITVLMFVVVSQAFGESLGRAAKVLCVLAFGLSFPGRSRFVQRPLVSGVDIFVGWVYLLLVLWVCGVLTNSLQLFSAQVILVWVVLTPLAQWAVALAGRKVLLHRGAQRWNRKQVVVIGATNLGWKVATALRDLPARSHDFLGFFDDRSDARVVPQARDQLLGNLSQVVDYVNAHGVNAVYITLSMGSQPRIVEMLEALQDTTASIYFVPDVFSISIIQGRLQDLNGVPVVGLCETPFTGINALVKRASDLLLASAILFCIWPILLVLAIGVKLSSPGPVIFKQDRNGLDGEEIKVYKFRSMRTMDNGEVVKQATKEDPRITRFGAFIRRTSLDELPQFINVLQGRMSIVGPRPHAVAHNEQYRKLIKAYMVRHKVKPGITGWAQVNGHRGETDSIDKMQARVEYDLEYLRNWSLAFDLQIILKTIRLVFFDRNAY